MNSTNFESVKSKLLEFFSYFGIPNEIVTDNGPPFQSFNFSKFCNQHNIKCTKSPPYHPQSNGLAERHVQIVKRIFKKMCLEETGLSMSDKINKFLIYQRNTPSAANSRTPSEIVFAFKPVILLDSLNKNKKVQFDLSTNKEIDLKEPPKKINVNRRIMFSKYKVGEKVLYRNHWKQFVKWIPAKVLKVLSTLTYLISVSNNVRYVHHNQLKIFKRNILNDSGKLILTDVNLFPNDPDKEFSKERENSNNVEKNKAITSESSNVTSQECDKNESTLRCSNRVKKIPKRFCFNEF